MFGFGVFLPSNWFFSWGESGAMVGGFLLDYALYRVWFTDFILLSLSLLYLSWLFRFWLFRSFEIATNDQSHSSIMSRFLLFFQCFRSPLTFLLIPLVLLTVSFAFSTPTSQAGVVAGLAILKWALFFPTLIWGLRTRQAKTALVSGILVSLGSQLVLGLAQMTLNRPLFGFWFFGEVDPNSIVLLAKTSYFGRVQLLPYGTLPHPNVFAGFALGVALLSSWHLKSKSLQALVMLLVGVVVVLTQSGASLLGFVILCFAQVYSHIPQIFTGSDRLQTSVRQGLGFLSTIFHAPRLQTMKYHALNFQSSVVRVVGAVWVVALAFAVVPLSLQAVQLAFPNTTDASWTRRVQLQQAAVRIFLERPLTGIGIGQFAPQLERFVTIPATTRFLQPVHHVGLLVIAELGLIGVMSIALTGYFVHRMYSASLPRMTLLCLVFFPIFSLDHYLVTIQQGQILLGLMLAWGLRAREASEQ